MTDYEINKWMYFRTTFENTHGELDVYLEKYYISYESQINKIKKYIKYNIEQNGGKMLKEITHKLADQ